MIFRNSVLTSKQTYCTLSPQFPIKLKSNIYFLRAHDASHVTIIYIVIGNKENCYGVKLGPLLYGRNAVGGGLKTGCFG
jgi:hypothetical protein